MTRKLRILFLLLLLPLTARSQQFTAKIEDVGSCYRLTFTVTSRDVEGFTPPSLAAFDVLSGPNQSTFSNYQIVNGKSSHSETTSFTYLLQPHKEGRQTIGAASIRAGRRQLRSRPITFTASTSNSGSGSARQRGAQSSPEETGVQQAGSRVTERDLFIDVTPSRTRVREQEAVLLTYKVHARVGVGLSNTQLTNKPDFKGLISQEIPLPGNQIQTTVEHRGGVTYRTGTILQYVIFPQQAGRLEIPSITFDCMVVQQDHQMDLVDAFFNGGGSIGVQVRRQVPVTTIQVDALPQPKPAAFSGAVGRFTMKGRILNHSIRTNDVATYRITLSGLGNLKLITPPTVNFPSDFETYDPKTNEKTKTTANGLSGELTFDYTFVPRNVGDYEIPPVEFVYFDTEKGSYQTIRTSGVKLHVAQGQRSNEDVDKQLALLRSDIRPIHDADRAADFATGLFRWNSLSYRLLQLFILLAGCALLFWTRRWQKNGANTVRRRRHGAARLATKRLAEAQQLLDAPAASDFYAALSKAISGFLADTFDRPQSELNAEAIRQLLTEKGKDAETIDATLHLLETCQLGQFAPIDELDRQAVYNQTVETLEQISK